MQFTKEQLEQIEAIGIDLEYSCSTYGRDKDLTWGFNEKGQIYADLEYEARDVDGDWGWACTRHNNITFDELLDTIRRRYSHFDTRSWN